MTGPYVGGSYDQRYGSQSDIARQEYEQFLARQRQLMDGILSTAHLQQQMDTAHQQAGRPQPANPMLPQDQSFLESFFQMPQFGQGPGGQLRPAARDELIAQARFWDIDNPENIDPAQLQQMIHQRRLQMPRDQQTTAGSASLAFLGAASEAGTATSRLIGNIFGDIGKIPFAGPALSKILGSEEAKRWMYDLSQQTSEFTEAARAAQPLSDMGAFDVLVASGKVGGYALPAMVVWNTIGAAAGYVPEAWAARVASPIVRAAIHGGLTGTVLEAGSDEPIGSKVFNIGLGMAFGASTAIPKIAGIVGMGGVGAAVGGQVGDTPEERTRHAIEGGIAGMIVGAAPLAIGAAAKIRQDIKSPFDMKVDAAVQAAPGGNRGGPGGPGGSGPRVQQAQARIISEPQLYEGPDYTVGEPELLVRSEPVGQIGQPEPTPQGPTLLGPIPNEPPPRPDIPSDSPWTIEPLTHEEAAATGDVMSKQATIMESATLPQALAKAEIGDAQVVQAARDLNPAGVSIVRGVMTPLRVIEEAGPGVTFVQRPNGWDALVGDVTPKQVKEFTDYGVFTGQKVVTATTGIEAEITGFSRGMVTLKREGGPPLRMRPENILPSRFSGPVVKAPDLWQGFKQDLLSYMNYEAEGAGMTPVLDMNDPRVPGMLAERMGDFLTRNGITDPAVRQAVDADFNHRWVQDLRELDYETKNLQDELLNAAVEAHNEVEASDSHHIVQSLEEVAEKRGFIWLTKPEQGGVLKDTINPGAPEVPLETDEAAREFLARTDRTLPDYTPASDVPLDVANMVPADLGREPRLATEDFADNLKATVTRANTEDVAEVGDLILGAGGGGGMGTLPPGGPPAGGYQPGGRGETLPEQFARMRRSDPSKVHALQEQFKGLLDNHLRYTRYAMLNGERMLTETGLDAGRMWKHYDDLAVAHDQAAREGAQWLNEWGDIMRQFPRKILRDGTVTRTHEIQDTNARISTWDQLRRLSKYEYDEATVARIIKADDLITDFNHRFFTNLVGDPAYALTMDREIYRYMSHVRARQAQGIQDPYAVPGMNPNVEFFAEHARQNNLQFRVMDARELGNHMVRAAMFKKYEAGPWQQAVEAWHLDRPLEEGNSPIPLPFRQYMADYLQLSRFGFDPRGELAVRGIQSVMGRVLKTPVTMREAQHMLNMPSGAMYMSMLAGRASIFFRDAIQPLMALAKVEMPYMGSTYGKVLKGAGQRISRTDENVLRDMYQRGLQGGWIQQENPNLEAAGFFEEQPNLRENELLHLTPEQAARRELLASIGDRTADLPAWLVRPSESRLSTLKWYAKEGQLNRLVVGESAYQQAKTYLSVLRGSTADAVLNLDPTREIGYDKFAERAFFSSFEPPIQRALKELVAAGDDEGAAMMFAREVSNWSQFKYGRKEVPSALRGNIGRYLSMFGSWTGQFLEATNSALSNGSTRHKVRFGMTVGAVSSAMYLLKHETGWSFDKWAWVPQAFQYAGSPFLEMAARGVAALGGAVNQSQGRPASEFERAALKEEVGTPLIGTALEFLPWTGYIRSGQEYSNAMHGTNPLEQIARYTITGDRGSRIDVQRQIEEMVRREGHVPEGTLSPNGGLMPGRPGSGYGMPHGGYAYPGTEQVAQPQNTLPPNSGVQDTDRVYMKNGYMVYDSPNTSRDGKVPTHRLDAPSGRQPNETWEQYEARVLSTPLSAFPPEAFQPINDPNLLRPEVRQKVDSLIAGAARDHIKLAINETYRPQVRQELLFQEGRVRGSNPVTWTLTSDHTTQGAADLVPLGRSSREQQDGYNWIQANGPKYGFKVLGDSDPGHVAVPYGMELQHQQPIAQVHPFGNNPGAGAMP
jgi:hypothetical protein